MSWIFEGRCADISLHLSETGQWSVHGTGSQDLPVHSYEIVPHVRGLPGAWSLCSIEDAELKYDCIGYGLKKFFAINEGRAAGMIHPTHGEGAAVLLSVVMPPELHAQIVATFRMVLSNPSVRYVISVDFLGIGEHATEHSPSIGDFLNPKVVQTKPYFSRKVAISFMEFRRQAASGFRANLDPAV